jgi:hypothetical protein
MTTLGKTAIVASVLLLLLAIPTPASAGGRNGGSDWDGILGAGILGGVIGGALAPAPQPQIIVVPAQPTPPPTIIVVPGYQPPPQPQTPTPKSAPNAVNSSCIGPAMVAGRLTLTNNCAHVETVMWGMGNSRREWVAFTTTATLPAGATRVWPVSSDYISFSSCRLGLKLVDVTTNRKPAGDYPGAFLICR